MHAQISKHSKLPIKQCGSLWSCYLWAPHPAFYTQRCHAGAGSPHPRFCSTNGSPLAPADGGSSRETTGLQEKKDLLPSWSRCLLLLSVPLHISNPFPQVVAVQQWIQFTVFPILAEPVALCPLLRCEFQLHGALPSSFSVLAISNPSFCSLILRGRSCFLKLPPPWHLRVLFLPSSYPVNNSLYKILSVKITMWLFSWLVKCLLWTAPKPCVRC